MDHGIVSNVKFVFNLTNLFRSTFVVDLGQPGKSLRLLPSTSLSQTYVVSDPGGCPSSTNNVTFDTGSSKRPDPCADSRGGLYTLESDKSAKHIDPAITTALNATFYNVTKYRTFGDFGANFLANGFMSTLSFGYFPASESKQNIQVPVMQFNDWNYTWTGFLGIHAAKSLYSTNSSDTSELARSSLMKAMNGSLIPSVSWGYTAGSYNRMYNFTIGNDQ
jgi:hypothetical protein